MHKLIPFNNSTSDILLEAEATRNQSTIHLHYLIQDPKNGLALPAAFSLNENEIQREDGLWNDTCFEMFLRPEGENSYYEFNFSLKPAWNQYFFTSYRQPQPPKPCNDFSLKKLNWDGQNLKVELSGINFNKSCEVSLTAVLKEKTGAVHYMALRHAGPEADFHHVESYILKLSY